MREIKKIGNKQAYKQSKTKKIMRMKQETTLRFQNGQKIVTTRLKQRSKFCRSQTRTLKLNNIVMNRFNEFKEANKLKTEYFEQVLELPEKKALPDGLRKYHQHRLQQVKVQLTYKLQLWQAYQKLVEIHCEAEDYDKAFETLAKASQLQVQQSQIQFHCGKINALQQKYEQALKCFDKAIQFNTNFEDCYFQKSLILAKLNRLEEANDALENFQQRVQVEFYELDCLRILFYEFGNLPKFYHYCKLILDQEPENCEILQKLGTTYYYQHNWSKAVKYLEKVVKIHPLSDGYCYWLARCFMHLKQFNKSFQYGCRNLEINENSGYCFRLGLEYLYRNDVHHAYKMFTYIEQRYPHLTYPINYPQYVDKMVSQHATNTKYMDIINEKISQSQILVQQQVFGLVNVLKRFSTMFTKTEKDDQYSSSYLIYKLPETQRYSTVVFTPYYSFLGIYISINSKQAFYMHEYHKKSEIEFLKNRNQQEFSSEIRLVQTGIFYELSGNQTKAKDIFLKLMQQQQNFQSKEQNWFSIFVMVCSCYFKGFPKLYIISKAQFMLTQMIKLDGHAAMKSLSWLLNVQPWSSQFFDMKNTATQLIRKNIVKVNEACQAISKLKAGFQHFEYTNQSNKLLEMVSKYLKYANKIINIILAEKNGNKIQKQLNKLIVFRYTIDLRRIIISKKSCYYPIFGVEDEVDLAKVVLDLLSQTSRQQKRKFIETFAFEHFLKDQLLRFIYNEIAFFFVQSKQSFQLAELLTNIKTNFFFQVKEVYSLLLTILQLNTSEIQNSLEWILCKSAPEGSISFTSQQNSNISFKIDLEDQIFLKTILIYSLQFKHFDEQYLFFRQLAMKSVFLNASSLFHRKDSNKFIVELLDSGKWQDNYFEQGFTVKTKRGDTINPQLRDITDPDEKMLFGVWQLGRTYIYSFLSSTAKGIGQIEQIGKFHCDIDFRNVVKFGDIFKIIDFDYFFTVRLVGTHQSDIEAYQNTMQLISQFLKIGKLNKEDNIINFLFPSLAQRYDADDDQKSEFDDYIQKVLEEIQTSEDKANALIKELEEYSYVFHLQQFERLMVKLLDPQVMSVFPNVMNPKQVKKIFECLGWLRNKQIGYKQFAEEIGKIKAIQF